jgi:hypothetical protein
MMIAVSFLRKTLYQDYVVVHFLDDEIKNSSSNKKERALFHFFSLDTIF